MDIIKPKGKGWEDVISFIYKYKVSFWDKNLKLVLPLLTDWCNASKKGETTRFAGLLALSIIQKTESEENFYIHKDAEENILNVVYNAANEIKSELMEIFDKVLANKWTKHNDPYNGLCSKILAKPYLALEVMKILPFSVIQMCGLLWQKREREDDQFGYERDSMESKYGLVDEFTYNYFPASAFQTPIYWLLQYRFTETLDFIIDFTNRVVETYSQSDYGKEDVEKVTLYINKKEVTQYLSWAIWSMYRGGGSPVVPYLLQSIHMALEKILLEFVQILKSEIVQSILLKILIDSKSASLTAVVCSIVLAYPDKFSDIAIILFKTIEFFHIDSVRSMNESLVLNPWSPNKEYCAKEREEAKQAKHRNSNLESLFLNYQFTGVKGFTEEQNTEYIEKLYQIIDQHKKNILVIESEKERNSLGILLARMDRRTMKPEIKEYDDSHYIVELNPQLTPELLEISKQATKQYEETFKYSSLRSWSNFLIGQERQNTSQRHEEYNNNPLLALAETKQLIDELKTGRSNGMLEYSIPAFSCSKLMIEHKDILSKEDKDYCREIILSSVSQLFSDNYNYQISDGVEASVHAIPSLISEYSDEEEGFILQMILILFDEMPLGAYKRICDYVIESIHESKLWELYPKIAQDLLLGYVQLKPIYNNIYTEKRKEKGFGGAIPKSIILQELETKAIDFSVTNISFDIQDIDSFDIQDLGIIYQLIPSKTKDEIHLNIIKRTLPKILPKLLTDRHSDKSEFDSNIYKTRSTIFERYAYFLLERDINEINIYLQPFIDSFVATDEMNSLIDKIISAEDYINKYEQFWCIWNRLYPKFIEVCNKSYSYHLSGVVKSYLLAWQWWREGVEEWHSLKEINLSLYANVAKDLGLNPSVLYSITQILNSIGSKFTKEGIEWIYTIISTNNSLELGDLEPNTLYYLEKVMRKFIFMNKGQIKKEIRLKNKVIPILDFMIERGSIHGYLLRESIL